MDSDILKVFGILMSLGIVGVGMYAAVTVIDGLANRLKGKAEPDVRPEELEYLRDRAEQVEGLSERVAELETRLDFAERLLTDSSQERHDTPAGSV